MKNENQNQQDESVIIEVKKFTTVTPKFTKEEWESGEGSDSSDSGDDSRASDEKTY